MSELFKAAKNEVVYLSAESNG